MLAGLKIEKNSFVLAFFSVVAISQIRPHFFVRQSYDKRIKKTNKKYAMFMIEKSVKISLFGKKFRNLHEFMNR